MLCLGIETSCDETALALVDDGRLAAQVLASQADMHALFGGVVPELASREHYRFLGPLFDNVIEKAGKNISDIDVVAVSRGPGLLGSLLVGVAFAKGLALGLGCRFLGINHLHAHLLSPGLERRLSFPCLGLVVSGGHTHIYRVASPGCFFQLGKTLDDAAGEIFDKIGNLIGIPYPGGRLLDALAREGRADGKMFPRPYLCNTSLDFSFSGLKTAAAQYIAPLLRTCRWPRPLVNAADAPQELKDFCASFNLAVVETLCAKLRRALDAHADLHFLILGGGVAANSLLRERVNRLMREYGGQAIMPSHTLCTDNGAMVAYAGWLLARDGFHHALDMETIPRGRGIPDDMRRDCASDRKKH